MSSYIEPIVSVVIPTRGRPTLLLRAIESVRYQTFSHFEIVVVIDGPDEDTTEALKTILDERISVIRLDRPVGGSQARNIGTRKSRGRYVAFLDDDDEWLPDKLAEQVYLALDSTSQFPVVTCRLIAQRQSIDEVWPTRKIAVNEPISEYLFCRENSIRQGEGFIQSSTLLVPRKLLELVPFRTGLPRHQDWDWILRASEIPGVEFRWVWKALVIYHIDSGRSSVSAGQTIESSLRWVKDNELITDKARAYFYATQVAVRCSRPSELWIVLRNTLRYPRALVIGLGLTFAPRTLVRNLRMGRVTGNA